MLPPTHRCWAEIDRGALRHNAGVLRAHLPAGTAIMGVVKANAYGHGLALVAEALRNTVEKYGVANLAEALEIRRIEPTAQILILGPSLPEERELVVRHGFFPSVSSLEEARAYSEHALRLAETAEIHFIVDTGMGRIGVWQDDAPSMVRAVASLPHLRLAGVATHLPSADEDEPFTRAQLAGFQQLVATLREELPPFVAHSENSAGALGFPIQAGDLVRAGLMLYGSSPLPAYQSRLRPALTWKTRVTLLRDVPAGRGVSYGRTFITPRPMRIATLAVGYADGYRRDLGGQAAEVLIRGRRCPLLGRVTMDQIMVDVTSLPAIESGEEVVLIGRQGEEEILAAELAEKAGTIPWEIFTGIGPRVTRVATD